MAWTERSVNCPKRDTWGILTRAVKLLSFSTRAYVNIARALPSSPQNNYLFALSAFKSPDEDKVATSISKVERWNLSWRRNSTRPQWIREPANINDWTRAWKVMNVARTVKNFGNFKQQLTKKYKKISAEKIIVKNCLKYNQCCHCGHVRAHVKSSSSYLQPAWNTKNLFPCPVHFGHRHLDNPNENLRDQFAQTNKAALKQNFAN